MLTYSVGGSATSGNDFTALSGTVTIAAGSTSATINVATINDALVEATEDVIVTLTGFTAHDPQVTIDGANDVATLDIIDNDTATVSIANTTDGDETGTIAGVFTVTQTAAASVDTVLTYSVGGSATSGNDFTALSGTVTIAAGSTSATINVATINDALVEATEDVIVTLTGFTAHDPNVTIDGAKDTATLDIIDNDAATVSIARTADGNETDPVAGVFTVTQTAAASVDTVLTYSVSGSATSGDDFTALSGTVTIAAGATAATIVVPVIDDAIVEVLENVTLSLATISGDPQITIDTANNVATIDIIDNDAATVSIAGTTDGDEDGAVGGVFTVTQSATSSTDTVLTYSIAGSADSSVDFSSLSGTVTIAAGATTATIAVPTIDDSIVEGLENVTLTLATISGDPQIGIDTANDVASIDVADNDAATVSIVGTSSGNEDGPVSGVFTVTQTAISSTDTVLTYTVGGSANSDDDFTALSGTVTIVAGNASATINVATIDDTIVEGLENVALTLGGISGDPNITIDSASNVASIDIIDNDAATVSIGGINDGDEDGEVAGLFVVTQTAVSSTDTMLTYTVAGSADGADDFNALSGTVTIDAGASTATIIVSTIDDAIVETLENVTLSLDTISGDPQITIDAANDAASINIADNDAATLSITGTTNGNEDGPAAGFFTVMQSAKSSTDTLLTYTVTGTADSGDDFTALLGSVTIAAGDTTTEINIATIDDAIVEGLENVTLTVNGLSGDPQLTIDVANSSASIDIADNDSATVSIAGTTDGDENGSKNGLFTVTQTAVSSTDTVLTYTVAGTADSGDDFAALSGTVTIVAGGTIATIDVATIDDGIVEALENITLTLSGISGDPEINIDTVNDSASIDIADNDGAIVSITGTTDGDESGPINGLFTVTQSATSSTATVLTYVVAGTTDSGNDFTALPGTVTIAAGDTTAMINVATIDDAVVEGLENVAIVLTGISSDPEIAIDIVNSSASIDITDNDAATVSIAGTTDAKETGSVSGVFTLTQTATSSTDTVLTYNVSGSADSVDDFASLSGTATIVAGSTTATINIATIDDAIVEALENVTITLATISGDPQVAIDSSNDEATITIADNDSATVSIAGVTNGNETGPIAGVFTVSQTAESSTDTTLSYNVTGSANSGDDFTALSGTITIFAGSTSSTINLATIDDSIVEGLEDVTITLATIAGDPEISIDSSNSAATITIIDNDGATVSIAATSNGTETGPVNGEFSVTQSGVSSTDTVLTYSVTGSADSVDDFPALSGTITIVAGSTSATINVATIDDALVEALEDVTIQLATISGDADITIHASNDEATVTITDNDSASHNRRE